MRKQLEDSESNSSNWSTKPTNSDDGMISKVLQAVSGLNIKAIKALNGILLDLRNYPYM